MTHRWKKIYDGYYEVSDTGLVRRLMPACGATAGRLRLQHRDRYGYQQVGLSCSGISFTKKVHSMVALAFIGKRPKGYVVDHIDSNKSNNSASNLRYITSADNILRGTGIAAENSRKSKCPRGHRYDRVDSFGYRNCRPCHNANAKRSRDRYK